MTDTTKSARELADSLHQQIMNLPCKPYDGTDAYTHYCAGHRDARHAAAAIAALRAEIAVPLQPVAWMKRRMVSADWDAYDFSANPNDGFDIPLYASPPAAPAEAAPMVMLTEVQAEVARATKKFPTWPTDPLHAVAVLGEEFGELTKAMLQLTYESHKTSAEEVRTEAIQTAAMAMRLVMSLERYRYTPCEQHSQGDEIAAKNGAAVKGEQE
jgi:NTP pyrophosphatase (non-canonical NTP hydrolase)